MPFGYKNAPQAFMRMIDSILIKAGLQDGVAAFVDDITAHGSTWESYLSTQKKTLLALAQENWLATVEKMYLGYTSIEMLGHVVEAG